MEKRVCVGSKVTVEIYLGRVTLDRNRHRYLAYERFPPEGGTTTFTIIDNENDAKPENVLHCGSFGGRAIMGARVGDEREANVGGLSISESPTGARGNFLKYKVIKIE